MANEVRREAVAPMLPQIAEGVLASPDAHRLLALFVLLTDEEASIPLLAPGNALVGPVGAQPGRTPHEFATVVAESTSVVILGSPLLYLVIIW